MVPQILAKIPLLSTQLYVWVLSWQLSLDYTWLKLNPISTPFSHSIFSSWGNYLPIVIHISNAGVLLYFISSRSIWNHSVVSHYCLPCISLIHFFLFFLTLTTLVTTLFSLAWNLRRVVSYQTSCLFCLYPLYFVL